MTEALEVLLTGRGEGACQGSIWLRSDGGDATVDVSATIVRAGGTRPGRRLPIALAVAGAAGLALLALAVAPAPGRSDVPLGGWLLSDVLPWHPLAPDRSERPPATPHPATPAPAAMPSAAPADQPAPAAGGAAAPVSCAGQIPV